MLKIIDNKNIKMRPFLSFSLPFSSILFCLGFILFLLTLNEYIVSTRPRERASERAID